MLKPKDDLRKDFRLMEFNDIVNHLLLRDAEARQRRLNIRLYSVAPLNEECGLIEWVHDLVGLRQVLMNIYKQRGKSFIFRTKGVLFLNSSFRKVYKFGNVFNPRAFLQQHFEIIGKCGKQIKLMRPELLLENAIFCVDIFIEKPKLMQ